MQSKLPAVFVSLEKENRRERISNHAACGRVVEQSRLWVVHRIKLWLLTHWDERGSNTRKDMICDKIYALMSDYYKSACKIIEENKTLVSIIAEELLRKDYLTFEDVEELINSAKC